MSTTRGGRKRPRTTPPSSEAAGRRSAASQARAARRQEPEQDVYVADGVRLQKVLAEAGLGSRRACEELITAGRVEVDGVTIHELGMRVDPSKAAIYVDGMRVNVNEDKVTVALNKPAGVVTTMNDPEGRQTVAEFVYNRGERLYHVGRLDTDSEGLLLLTNDGELAHRLTHPKYEVIKTYLVECEGRVSGKELGALLSGVELEDGPAKVDRATLVDSTPMASLVEVQLHEGRNRIVRRMFDGIGHKVVRLVRTQVGPIKLGNLRPGSTRVLGKTELGTLMDLVGL